MCAPSTLPAVCSRCWCRSVVVLTADVQGNPSRTGGRSLPTAPLRSARLAPAPAPAPAAVIEGRGEKNKKGSVQFSTPPMQQHEGLYISPLLAASTNHVAFSSSIIPGLKGGRKEIRPSTSFADQVAFPGCSVCLLDFKMLCSVYFNEDATCC